MFLALLGCQAKARKAPPPPRPTGPPPIENIDLRDINGDALVASVRPDHPCRAVYLGATMVVAGPPLSAQLGSEHWTGEDHDRATFFAREGSPVARLLDNGDELSIVDGKGVPIVHIVAHGDSATVADSASRQLREVVSRGGTIFVNGTPLVATGTHDLALVALMASTEVTTPVRMLAACRRVLRARPEGT
jgi:hypothetical protein